MDLQFKWLLFIFAGGTVFAKEVTFPSGTKFNTIDPSKLGASIADLYADPKNTGSYLFNSSAYEEDAALSLNVLVDNFRTAGSKFFRAHPVFITCLQNVLTNLKNRKLKSKLRSGFKSKTEIGGSSALKDLYSRSGSSAVVEFADGVSGDVVEIAKSALKLCPVMFMKIQRDIGVILMSSGVQLFMTGPDEKAPHFSIDGYTGSVTSGTIKDWARQAIDTGVDSIVPASCVNFERVESGKIFPNWTTSASQAVGSGDFNITRGNNSDFNKLLQFIGGKTTNIKFINPSYATGWCELPPSACECVQSYVGHAWQSRCPSRLMTYRLLQVVTRLQKLLTIQLPANNILVVKAWEESPGNGEFDKIRGEGRGIVVKLESSNTASNLETLSQLATCAKADYVKHNGDSLNIAVKKMKGGTEASVEFTNINMLVVEPPEELAEYYVLPKEFEGEEDEYPLLYGDGREDMEIEEDILMKTFMSPDDTYKYFRLRPGIAKCYKAIVFKLNKFLKPTDAKVEVDVIRGFLTNNEQEGLFSSLTDERYNTHNLGVAMEIQYKNGSGAMYTSQHLLQTTVEVCAPIFEGYSEHMSLILFADSVYISMNDIFELWVEPTELVKNFEEYEEQIVETYKAAIEQRIVDPDDIDEACSLAVVPMEQSAAYKYQLPEITKRKRRRRSTDPEQCVPDSTTLHCTSSLASRKNEVEKIKNEIKRLHLWHDETELIAALNGCFYDCGTCLEGSIFEEKEKHCSNLVHWMPFQMHNESKTNLYSRDSNILKEYACYKSGGHCLHKSKAYAALASNIYKVFRHDETKSEEENIYSFEDNPSPLMQILEQTYAMHARGVVTVWVTDETDIKAMEDTLKVVFMYNKHVTRVDIYVQSEGRVSSVNSVIQDLMEDMSTSACPYYTKLVLSSFTVGPIPLHITKREVRTKSFILSEEYQNEARQKANVIFEP